MMTWEGTSCPPARHYMVSMATTLSNASYTPHQCSYYSEQITQTTWIAKFSQMLKFHTTVVFGVNYCHQVTVGVNYCHQVTVGVNYCHQVTVGVNYCHQVTVGVNIHIEPHTKWLPKKVTDTNPLKTTKTLSRQRQVNTLTVILPC